MENLLEAMQLFRDMCCEDDFQLAFDPDGFVWKVRDASGDFIGIGADPHSAIYRAWNSYNEFPGGAPDIENRAG